MTSLFLELLQVALGEKKYLSRMPSVKEWNDLYSFCQKQSIVAFVFTSLDLLNKSRQKPPMALLYSWIGQSEHVKMQNELMNNEAARLTSLFEQAGHKTAILKGQANARLYPQPWSRQPGDIDIWVDGGKDKVINTLKEIGLLKGDLSKYQTRDKSILAYHHIHLPQNKDGIDVEIHFRPSSGNFNPITNRRLQTYLEQEIREECILVNEGFRVPNIRFALVMQLSHIQGHLISEGVGMRQIIDYYYLLKKNGVHKKESITDTLRDLGLNHIAGAMMWVLHEVLGLEKEYLIAPMDEKRGLMLLQTILKGGNFGHYYHETKERGSWQRIISKHKRRWQLIRFDAPEAIWQELIFLGFFVTSIPERIKRRKWSLE